MNPADVIRRFARTCIAIGETGVDTETQRLRRFMLAVTYLLLMPAGFIWGCMYVLFNEPVAAIVPYSFLVLTALSLLLFRADGNFAAFRFRQLLFILLLPFLLTVSLGGFSLSSAVILWAVLCPIGALIFDERRNVLPWSLAYAGLALVVLLLPPLRSGNNLPPALIDLLYFLNIVAVSGIGLAILTYFVHQNDTTMRLLAIEQQKSENLLLNILPKEIAAILKNSPRTIADQFDEATVMFADMVGFTRLTAELPPVEMLELLNEVFSYFDELVDRYGVEKIRTIGDSYMVVSGVPSPRPDHAHALVHMALDMQAWLQERRARGDTRIDFRIGINSGPLIAGVIGRKKFIYDLWGDSVNTAARMESHGEPGKIQITQATYDLIRDAFECQPRGPVNVKGKGELNTYFVITRKAEPANLSVSLA